MIKNELKIAAWTAIADFIDDPWNREKLKDYTISSSVGGQDKIIETIEDIEPTIRTIAELYANNESFDLESLLDKAIAGEVK